MISVIMPSDAKTPELRAMTENAIRTCGCAEVIVIEKQPIEYAGAITIRNNDLEFNYNRALNYGLQVATGDYVALCNNDLVFFPNFKYIEEIMKLNDIHSASPYTLNQRNFVPAGNYKVDGFEIGKILCGWCIVISRHALKLIGKLDETYDFWYSDNAYAEQLKDVGISHSLICNVFIEHLESTTLKTLNHRDYYMATTKMIDKWKKKPIARR